MIWKIREAPINIQNRDFILTILTFAFICLALILIFSSKHFSPKSLTDRVIPNWFENVPIAHRGLVNDDFPENTLGAFENAVLKGFAIELDVLDAKDSIPVVFHDETLMRLIGEDVNIHGVSVEQLCDYKIKGSSYNIPTFEEALRVIDGKTPIIIDIKQSYYKPKFLAYIKECLQKYDGPFLIQSFNPLVLRWFYAEMPDALRVQSLEDFNGTTQMRWLIILKDNLFMFISKPNIVSCKRNLLENGLFNDLRAENAYIIGWLFNMEEWESRKYDSLCKCFIIGEVIE